MFVHSEAFLKGEVQTQSNIRCGIKLHGLIQALVAYSAINRSRRNPHLKPVFKSSVLRCSGMGTPAMEPRNKFCDLPPHVHIHLSWTGVLPRTVNASANASLLPSLAPSIFASPGAV